MLKGYTYKALPTDHGYRAIVRRKGWQQGVWHVVLDDGLPSRAIIYSTATAAREAARDWARCNETATYGNTGINKD